MAKVLDISCHNLALIHFSVSLSIISWGPWHLGKRQHAILCGSCAAAAHCSSAWNVYFLAAAKPNQPGAKM